MFSTTFLAIGKILELEVHVTFGNSSINFKTWDEI
jgi:hypothetical protein